MGKVIRIKDECIIKKLNELGFNCFKDEHGVSTFDRSEAFDILYCKLINENNMEV